MSVATTGVTVCTHQNRQAASRVVLFGARSRSGYFEQSSRTIRHNLVGRNHCPRPHFNKGCTSKGNIKPQRGLRRQDAATSCTTQSFARITMLCGWALVCKNNCTTDSLRLSPVCEPRTIQGWPIASKEPTPMVWILIDRYRTALSRIFILFLFLQRSETSGGAASTSREGVVLCTNRRASWKPQMAHTCQYMAMCLSDNCTLPFGDTAYYERSYPQCR